MEVGTGADPLHNDSLAYGAIQNNPTVFNLYTSNSVMDLSFGEMMISVISNAIHVQLTMQATADLRGNSWSNVGSSMDWMYPVNTNKAFFRFLGEP